MRIRPMPYLRAPRKSTLHKGLSGKIFLVCRGARSSQSRFTFCTAIWHELVSMKDRLNPSPRSTSLAELEQEAIRKLAHELQEYLAASEQVYNLIGIALERAPCGPVQKVSRSCFATRLLLIRLRNDLRCAALLAVRGYGEQSCSLVASLYETAFTIASISGDDELAQKWFQHDNPDWSFLSAKSAAQKGARKLGIPNPQTHPLQSYDNVYKKLCMVKHVNPISQRRRGYAIVGKRIELLSGPDISDEGLQTACFALENSVGLANVAAASFGKHHLSGDQQDLLREIHAADATAAVLNKKSAARWTPKKN
jgi:hypothetical protein